MNSETDLEIQLGRHWPEQIIVDHAPYWRAWRKHHPVSNPMSEVIYDVVGKNWIPFANGKNLGPQLMIDWMLFARSIRSYFSESGLLSEIRVVKYRGFVRAYLRWLHLVGAIAVDPGDCLPRTYKIAPKPKEVFTHAEYLRMTAYGRARGGYNSHLWLVTLGYHTGMSLIDCCRLLWREVHLPEDGPCFVRRVRSKMAIRSIGMSTIPIIVGSELWVWFKQLRKIHEREMAFEKPDIRHAADREYVCPEAADWSDTRSDHPSLEMRGFIIGALGDDLKGRSFKNLRNTFASRLINAGTDAVLVSKMTGHKSLTQLSEYVIPDQAKMQAEVLKALRFVEEQTANTGAPAERANEANECS